MIDNLSEEKIFRKISKIDFFDVVICLSRAIDLVSPLVSNHHLRVAYIAFNIGKEAKLSKEQLDRVVKASCIHDIGAVDLQERKDILEFDYNSNGKHEEIGCKYTKGIETFSDLSDIIKYHHKKFDFKTKDEDSIPIESQIIHLADRIDAAINRNEYILYQVEEIVKKIEAKSNVDFDEKHINAFKNLAKNESFWLYLMSNDLETILRKEVKFAKKILNIDDYYNLAKWFSTFIDFRSEFTTVHTMGVAKTAGFIGKLMGLSELEIKILEISGFLHDIGKLRIPNEILEKNGKLDKAEFLVIKSHTFYTYTTLEVIKQFDLINQYASYHHEHIDGSGYPFHIKGKKMLTGSRILCVADIITALSEDRPYRKGMEKYKIVKLLEEQGNDELLDASIVKLAIDNIDDIIENISIVQLKRKEELDKFWSSNN